MTKTALSVAILAFLPACDGPSESAPVLEPNFGAKSDGLDAVDDRGAIAFGAEARHTFSGDFQFFQYTFRARESAEIAVEVTQLGTAAGLDTTLFLYRLADGEEPSRIAFDDDDGWGALSRIDDFRLYSDDRYAIVVGTGDGQGRGQFRLTLECLSGECAPEEPVMACPAPLHDATLECVTFESRENGHEIPLYALASEVCATESQLEEVREILCDEANRGEPWCEGADVVADCAEAALTTFPDAAPLASTVSELPVEAAASLAAAANRSERCGFSSELAGCEFTAQVYTYDADEAVEPSLAQLLAHARAQHVVGPGVFAVQDLQGTRAGMQQYIREFDVEAEYADLLDALDLDPAAAVYGTATEDEFRWAGGDCYGMLALAQFPDDGVVISLGDLFCYDGG